MPRTQHLLTESGVIRDAAQLFATRDPAVEVGVGDDTAVLRPAPGLRQLVTTDTLVAGVHFDLRYMQPYEVGWKALAVNVSDIAAMGGTPRHALAQLGLPPRASQREYAELARGVAECADEYSVSVVGGDTFAAPQWQLGFTVLGECAGTPLLRSGARAGDVLWLSGTPGLSQTGLHLLWAKAAGQRLGNPTLLREARPAHTLPLPQTTLGLQLAQLGATAALDTSDSLAQSVLHLAGASGLGVRLDFSGYAFADTVSAFARDCRKRAGEAPAGPGFAIPAGATPEHAPLRLGSLAHYLLYSAEDYALLFAAPPSRTRALRAAGHGLQPLGELLPPEAGARYADETGAEHALAAIGWQHR